MALRRRRDGTRSIRAAAQAHVTQDCSLIHHVGLRMLRVAASPPYLHPFVCVACRRAFKRSGTTRNEAPCPACGSPAILVGRKFKPPRRSNVAQWAKVEALVNLGFRFDTIYDADGAIIPYPSSERGIPAFAKRVAQVAEIRADKAAQSKAALALRRRRRQAARATRKIRSK